MPKLNIVLVGFMGTGKSTIGRLAAEKLAWRFIDSDYYIAKQVGMSIPEIFSKKGEAYFREAETAALQEILSQSHQVVSTGGGVVLAEANRNCMKQNGYVVALAASEKTIIERVGRDRNRPLLQGKPRLTIPRLMEQRKHAYEFADAQIVTDQLRIDQVVQNLLELYKLS